MHRILSNGARAGLALLLAGAGASAAQPEPQPVVTVLVDNAKVIRLPEKARTVIVGNPFIADITLQKNGVLVLTGKSFGATNLIALDAGGALIAETMIRVEASQTTTVTVQRGLDRQSFSCTPNCQPSAQLGDSAESFGAVSGQADARRRLSSALDTNGGGSGVPGAPNAP